MLDSLEFNLTLWRETYNNTNKKNAGNNTLETKYLENFFF